MKLTVRQADVILETNEFSYRFISGKGLDKEINLLAG